MQNRRAQRLTRFDQRNDNKLAFFYHEIDSLDVTKGRTATRGGQKAASPDDMTAECDSVLRNTEH